MLRGRQSNMLHIRHLRTFLFFCLLYITFPGAAATAQGLSAGCNLLNNPFFDATYTLAGTPVMAFNANEQIIATVTPPSISTQVSLTVGGVLVDTAPIPGILSYTFPTDRMVALSLDANIGVANWTVSCGIVSQPVSASVIAHSCPIFHDGRINHCDTFNPIVLYGNQDEDAWSLDIYASDGSGLLWQVSTEAISAVDTCPDESTEIARNVALDIVLLRLSTCQFFMTAPMNEPGKFYFITFNELYPHSYYKSGTEFAGS